VPVLLALALVLVLVLVPSPQQSMGALIAPFPSGSDDP
jgi:hypothetical protein